MEIAATLFLVGLAGVVAGGLRKSAVEAYRSQKAAWADVSEELQLPLVTSGRGPLGTDGVRGVLDGMDVSVTRPSPFLLFRSGSGDRIIYEIGWPPASPPMDIHLEFVHEWDERSRMGVPARPDSLDGLRLLRGDPSQFAGWLTPEREAALGSLLVDGTGQRRHDRRVLVEDGRLELVLDWRDRSTEEIATTTRRLIEVGTVLRTGPTASPAIEPPAVHPLDGVAAELQDEREDTVVPVVVDPEPVDRTDREVVADEPEPLTEPEQAVHAYVTEVHPPAASAPGVSDFAIEDAVAVLLDRSLMGHEATALFETQHKDRVVSWSGTVTASRAVPSDADFNSAGLRTTVHVFRIDGSQLVTNQVHSVLLLPMETEISVGDEIAFTGRLQRVDRTMRNFFIADATLTGTNHTR